MRLALPLGRLDFDAGEALLGDAPLPVCAADGEGAEDEDEAGASRAGDFERERVVGRAAELALLPLLLPEADESDASAGVSALRLRPPRAVGARVDCTVAALESAVDSASIATGAESEICCFCCACCDGCDCGAGAELDDEAAESEAAEPGGGDSEGSETAC